MGQAAHAGRSLCRSRAELGAPGSRTRAARLTSLRGRAQSDLVETAEDPAASIIMENHEFGMPPANYAAWPVLNSTYDILTTSRDRRAAPRRARAAGPLLGAPLWPAKAATPPGPQSLGVNPGSARARARRRREGLRRACQQRAPYMGCDAFAVKRVLECGAGIPDEAARRCCPRRKQGHRAGRARGAAQEGRGVRVHDRAPAPALLRHAVAPGEAAL